jgi:hypothetical protein
VTITSALAGRKPIVTTQSHFAPITAAVILVALTALTIGGGPGDAAPPPLTFNVNLTADIGDPLLSDNNCDVDLPSVGNQCTLRAAISQANFTDGLQIINVPAGTYNLTIASSIQINEEVIVDGAG